MLHLILLLSGPGRGNATGCPEASLRGGFGSRQDSGQNSNRPGIVGKNPIFFEDFRIFPKFSESKTGQEIRIYGDP